MSRLSTHVLDTAHGRPAEGVRVFLYRVSGGEVVEPYETSSAERTLLTQTHTNADGRTDAPLLTGEALTAGVYELVFGAGAYFRGLGVALSDPPFLDEVVVRFGVADATRGYHVPLLLSPWSYSTYRGS